MNRAPEQVPGPRRAHLFVASQERAAFEEVLRTAAGRLRVQYCPTPLEAMAAALRHGTSQPILFLDGPLIFRQEAGAMRLLDQAPGLLHQVVLLPLELPEAEALQTLLQGTRVRFLPLPLRGEQLLETVESFLGPLHPWEEIGRPMADLVRGLADALNNPLASLSGFLQLLELQLGPAPDPSIAATLAQIHQSVAGLTRVVLDLGIAGGDRPPALSRLDLVALIREACMRSPCSARLDLAPLPESLPCQGDPELVGASLDALLLLADSVAAEGVRPSLAALRKEQHLEIRIAVAAVLPSRWRADRTFHPFFLSRALQAPGIGLAPAVAVGAARTLGGGVEATWSPEGALHLVLRLP